MLSSILFFISDLLMDVAYVFGWFSTEAELIGLKMRERSGK